MSSSYIVEPQDSGSEKKDDTLIIVVNDDGTISVDQATLHNMIINQSSANVSVVRLGQTEADAENGDITLTVDPPPFMHTTTSSVSANSSTDSAGLVDPFMEMDPEQLKTIETALQSEEAKQMLGENVTAMLDMLTVEEQQNKIRYSIQLDHCYTSRFSPTQPRPKDPLPIVDDSPDSDVQYVPPSSRTVMSSINDINSAKGKNIVKNAPVPLQSKQMNRPVRKAAMTTHTNVTAASRAGTNVVGTPKLPGHPVPRNITNVQQGVAKAQGKNNEEEEDEEMTESSTESSESEPTSDNDNDSDFGPRSTKRGSNIRARGGRKGLNTRGGSTAVRRRAGQNKQLDIEQVRRLDMEMAAAVSAMKTPEKDDKSERFNPKSKRQVKTSGGKKKEEPQFAEASPSASEDVSPVPEKPLQTTNLVKANLISANMIKGDMIITKPGQGRSNQKVTFIQKQIPMKPSELKNIGIKKPVIVPKGKLVSQPETKFFATKDGKLVQLPMTSKTVTPISPVKVTMVPQLVPQKQPVQIANQGSPVQQQPKIVQQQVLPTGSVQLKFKIKEKRKSDASMESLLKVEESPAKVAENKALDNAKKPKKDVRKVPGFVADTLGPALFSTPDIIRRVGANNVADNNGTPATPTTPTAVSPSASSVLPAPTAAPLNIGVTAASDVAQATTSNFSNKKTISNTLEQPAEPESQLSLDGGNSVMPDGESEHKAEVKEPLAEELQPSLDSVPNTASEGIIQPAALPHVPNHVVSKNSGIEGEEHLLATLEMEASKHEDELLAEALLLQEELGVDLAEHPALVDSTPPVTEALTPSSILIPTLAPTEELSKPAEVAPAAPQAQTSTPKEMSKKSPKDDKEPIQIIRGNRVITLPPIEAPATRSKRLQAKTETPKQKNPEPIKKPEKLIPPVQQIIPNKEELRTDANEEEDDDDEDDEQNSDSEDDPDRLWCICKRPHNNRFMICCDVCEDWFHGKCVHVSKAMGQQMEEKGIEWVCPNCLRKKAEEEKAKTGSQSLSAKQRTKIELASESPVAQAVLASKEASSSADYATPVSGTMQCVVCKKEARNSSIYCSDACILAHAQETLTKDKPTPTGSNAKPTKSPITETVRIKPEARVVVFDRKTGKLLTGADAPTRSNLRMWLKENPSFEVVGANNINTLQIGGKLVTQIQTSGKTTKLAQLSPIKVQTIPKMIYTKVAGSKQTILAANKKITIIPTQQQVTVSPGNKSIQLKQTTILTTPGKIPVLVKSAMPRNLTPTQLKIQAAGSPKQMPIKKQEAKPSPSQLKQTKLTLAKKPEAAEPSIRVNIRRTLTELLSSRIKETEDLKLTDAEIASLAFNIELEMYKYFKDTGSKYKAKYRSLVFNIKDTKNLTLFRKIADRSLTPDAVVRLSPDEMASQELAEWREKETKHQLEMIKKNELDLMAQAKSIVVKTHKGEQIIENDGGIDHVDPKTPVQDIVTALNSGDSISSTVDDATKDKDKEDRLKSRTDAKKSKGADERRRKDKERDRERDSAKFKGKDRRERSRSRHRHSRDRSKTRDKSKERKLKSKENKRDKEREHEKDKDRERNKDKVRKENRERGRQKEDRHKGDGRARNSSGSRESKDVDKREEERKKETEKKKETSPPPAEKPIEDRLWRHVEDEATTNTIDGNDSDISDREPSSTVTIKTPDINEEPEREKEQEVDKETPAKTSWQTVWRGFVNMVDVAKFFITAQEVSGNVKDLMDDLPDTVDVVGRISHETVWDYISKMKRTGSKEILVIRLTAANDEEKIPYITLYSYLNSRSRLGVVGNVSKNIKDFYIMPFSSQSTIPPVLLPLTGPGFEEHRPHLLLGIIVRNKKKRLSAISSAISSKSKKESDRSYTPPLVGAPKEKTSSPPPGSSPMLYHKAALDGTSAAKEKVTQLTLESLNKAHIGMSRGVIDTATICKIVPELSSKIVDLTASPSKTALDDDGDEPYSPGEMDDDMNDSLQTVTDTAAGILASSGKSTDLQRKMDELNRQIEERKQQIEEQKQQIQSISSSFLDEATPTLPGLGLDPPTNDCDEAYSPSDTRSFTPPPPGIKLVQPILDKVSDITIPPNLQEILANVKRQESTKVDPYLPSKPSASFLPAASASLYQSTERYSPTSSRISQEKVLSESTLKENKSTLSSLSDLDLIRKAEEELAAVAAATAAASTASTASSVPTGVPPPSPTLLSSVSANLVLSTPLPIGSINDATIASPSQLLSSLVHPSESSPALEASKTYVPSPADPFKKSFTSEQPKPPGLEDEDFPAFLSATPPVIDPAASASTSRTKIQSKSGIVLNVKRKSSDDRMTSPTKLPRTKTRWGQGPSE